MKRARSAPLEISPVGISRTTPRCGSLLAGLLLSGLPLAGSMLAGCTAPAGGTSLSLEVAVESFRASEQTTQVVAAVQAMGCEVELRSGVAPAPTDHSEMRVIASRVNCSEGLYANVKHYRHASLCQQFIQRIGNGFVIGGEMLNIRLQLDTANAVVL